jgi:hypothetical protein
MTEEIIRNIVLTTIGVIVSSSVGYLAHKAKCYRQTLKNKQLNEQIQNEALKMLIQNKLTIVYYKYEAEQEMPDIVFRNWENLFKIYKSLGGNDYVDSLNDKIKTWRTTVTDVFKEK